MANNWDDILAEPIASLSDPTAASPFDAERGVEEQRGGWLAVQALRDISPRSQDAPVTMVRPRPVRLPAGGARLTRTSSASA